METLSELLSKNIKTVVGRSATMTYVPAMFVWWWLVVVVVVVGGEKLESAVKGRALNAVACLGGTTGARLTSLPMLSLASKVPSAITLESISSPFPPSKPALRIGCKVAIVVESGCVPTDRCRKAWQISRLVVDLISKCARSLRKGRG